MNTKRYILLTVACLIIATGANNTNASDADISEYERRIAGTDELIEQAIHDFNIPGLAITIVADGKVIKSSSYGYRSIEEHLPVTENTQFSIGSATKAFTSFIIGTLVDEGKVQWDTRIKEVLPDWQTSDPYITENATLRDLLSHRTGLARHELIWFANPKLTAYELLKKLPHLSFSKGYREGFVYSNLMYGVLGIIAEKVSGESWKTLLKTRVLDKLGMNNTNANQSQMHKTNNYAQPYIIINQQMKLLDEPFQMQDVMEPAGAINTTIKDMANWLTYLTSQTEEGNANLINMGTLQQIQTPHITVTPFVGDADNSPLEYGLGWFIRSYRGHYQVQHGGNVEGFTTSVFTYPNEGVGIAIMTNVDASSLPQILAMDLSDMLLNLEPRNYLNFAKKQLQQITPEQDSRSYTIIDANGIETDLSEYTGEYSHPGYGKILLHEINGELELKYNTVTERFVWKSTNEFVSLNTHNLGIFEDESLIFSRDKSGKIVSVDAPFDFPKPITFSRQNDFKICFFVCTDKDLVE